MSTHAGTTSHAHHISPVKLYVQIWIGLMILTAITVFVYNFDFGSLNIVVAMTVATIKASLVVLFFMHLKYDKPFHAVAFAIGIVFFGLLLGLTLLDVQTRTDPIPSHDFAVLPTPIPRPVQAEGGHGGATSEAKPAASEAKPEAKAEAKPTAAPAEHK